MMAPLRGPKAHHGHPGDTLADSALRRVLGTRGSLEETHSGSLTLSLPLDDLPARTGLEVLDVPALPALLSTAPVGDGLPEEGLVVEGEREEGGDEESGCPPQIIPGLPDELGFECLLRVHRGDHRSASEVSHEWHTALRVRMAAGLTRDLGADLLYASCRGPLPVRLKPTLLQCDQLR